MTMTASLIGTMHAADGFALCMVAILALGLGTVALLLYRIYRHGQRRETDVERLLEELRRDQEAEEAESRKDGKHPAAPTGGPELEPWEKDSDWWK